MSEIQLRDLAVRERLQTERARKVQDRAAELLAFADEVRSSGDIFPAAACISATLYLTRQAMTQVKPLHRLPNWDEQTAGRSQDATTPPHNKKAYKHLV